jgi:hypothetical protein
MATFSGLWQEVRTAIGERTDIDTNIKSAVNDAMVDLVLMFRIREMISSTTDTTSEGENALELDTNVYDVISVRNDDDDVTLEKGDWHEYDNLDNDDSDAYGTPTKWFVDGMNLILYSQTPDDSDFSITYRHLSRPDDMINNTDAFPLPREWERPCKLLAKSYVFELLGQNEKAVAAYQQMTAEVASRKSMDYFQKILSKTATVDFYNGPDDWPNEA